jgi:hypothetical protein
VRETDFTAGGSYLLEGGDLVAERRRGSKVPAASKLLRCPEDAGLPIHYCGNTARKGWSWPKVWASSAPFSPAVGAAQLLALEGRQLQRRVPLCEGLPPARIV